MASLLLEDGDDDDGDDAADGGADEGAQDEADDAAAGGAFAYVIWIGHYPRSVPPDGDHAITWGWIRSA